MFVFIQQFVDLFLNINLKIAIFHYDNILLFWFLIIDDKKFVTICQLHELLIKNNAQFIIDIYEQSKIVDITLICKIIEYALNIKILLKFLIFIIILLLRFDNFLIY